MNLLDYQINDHEVYSEDQMIMMSTNDLMFDHNVYMYRCLVKIVTIKQLT